MKNILITGASGFLGVQLLDRLTQHDVNVTAIIRSDADQKTLAQYNIANFVLSKNVFLESAEWWKNICKEIDIVIHAAWFVNPKEYLDSDQNLQCLTGSITMAQACVESGIHKFVGIGTCFEYDVRLGNLYLDTPLNHRPFTLEPKLHCT